MGLIKGFGEGAFGARDLDYFLGISFWAGGLRLFNFNRNFKVGYSFPGTGGLQRFHG